jgi:PAS domain S-box-containing protein
MAENSADETARIRAVLKEHPLGLSIKEIAAAVGMSRNSMAKYLDVLTATGQLELRHVGNAKLYTLSQRVPVGNIINYARELIIVLDHTLQIIEASDSLCTFAGASRQAVLNTRLSTAPTALLTPAEENELVSLMSSGVSWRKEIRLVRGADEIYLDGRFIPTTLQNGEPGITLILEDTTERRRAERAMRERDRLLHTIFQIPSIPRFFIDRNHKVVFWDRALEIMTGLKSEEMIGTNRHWRAFYPEERPCLVDLLVDGNIGRIVNDYRGGSMTRATQDGYESTEFFPSLGLQGKWLHITASLIRDPAGNITGAMETIEDITDRKKREFVVEE